MARPKLRRFTSKKQSRFMYSQHPTIAKRWTRRMKKSGNTQHPIKPLPQYSQTKAAKKSRRKRKG